MFTRDGATSYYATVIKDVKTSLNITSKCLAILQTGGSDNLKNCPLSRIEVRPTALTFDPDL